MLGLINRGLRAFVLEFHGQTAWKDIVSRRDPLFEDFEVLIDYPPQITTELIDRVSRLRGCSPEDLIEDFGTFLVTEFWDARLRDLLLSCGENFREFLRNLPYLLHGLSNIGVAWHHEKLRVLERDRDHFDISSDVRLGLGAALILGLTRALADQYKALITCTYVVTENPRRELFAIRIFKAGRGSCGRAAPKRPDVLSEYFRAEILKMILDEARGLIGRLDTARATAQLKANNDPLTGVLNRRGLSAWWQENERALGSVLLIHIDLDRFKPINDRFGHASGDHVLQILGQRLKNTARKTDAVARLGGDEFAFVAQAALRRSVDRICDRVLNVFSDPFALQGQDVEVTASLGCVWQRGQGVSLNTLIQIADAALYNAKSNQGGQFVLHDLGQIKAA